jgi:hypothetical protein
MTEAEWLSCTNPKALLAWFEHETVLSERKARLLAVACCRRVWVGVVVQRSLCARLFSAPKSRRSQNTEQKCA